MSPAPVIRCGERKLPVLSITMRNGIVEQNERFSKSIASIDKSNYKVVTNGQLVIAFPIDEGLLYTQDVVSEGIMSPAYNIWDVDYSCINRRFLVTFFHSSFAFAYYKAKLKGTTQRRRVIDKSDLLSMPIPVPPIGEQERIVAELDLLQGIIEKKKEQLKAYDQLAQSIFYTMFSDILNASPTLSLKDIASYIIGLTYKPYDVSETGTIVLRSSNIQNNLLDFKDTVRVNVDIKDNKYVQDGDILMCARNGSSKLVGKVARIKNLSEKMSFGAFMTIIRSDYNDYLFHFFLSDYFRNQLTTSKTATINQITSRMLGNIKLNIPSLSLQQEFAEKVEAIERQKALVQQSIEEVQTMFDYTMDKYFG